MKKFVGLSLAVCVILQIMAETSHTLDEQCSLARDAIRYALSQSRDNLSERVCSSYCCDTWEGFLGCIGGSGWTLKEKKDAFLAYLFSLGSVDMTSAADEEKPIFRVAIAQCDNLSFTNACPALRAIGLNPKALYRDDAIEYAVKFGSLDTNTVNFVETIMTNCFSFTLRERGAACGELADKILCSATVTNLMHEAMARRATDMLYRNRKASPAGSIIMDRLFGVQYEGYATSSNRLDYALFVLDYPGNLPYYRSRFTSITNQLLSSGQPLRQLNIGETGE